jgi:hypothetical protein
MLMFQLFRRACPINFGSRPSEQDFKARSAGRDAETDQLRVSSILQAIEYALNEAEREQSGLSRRVENVLARAAITAGNGTDEYLEREPLDTYHQHLFGIEISNGQRRLKELSFSVKHFEFLKIAPMSRFPDGKGSGIG